MRRKLRLEEIKTMLHQTYGGVTINGELYYFTGVPRHPWDSQDKIVVYAIKASDNKVIKNRFLKEYLLGWNCDSFLTCIWNMPDRIEQFSMYEVERIYEEV